MEISQRRILITGGSLGIGHQLAIDLSARGADVLICGRNKASLEAAAAAHRQLHTFACDVRDYQNVLALKEEAERVLGGPDVIINNAAIFRRLDLQAEGDSVDQWLDEVDINLMGTLRVTHAFLPDLVRLPSATIINVTSPLAYLPLAAAPIYSATKAAIHSWTVSLRHQLRGTSVSVRELNPPVVDTRMNQNNPSVEGMKRWSTQDFSAHVVGRLKKSGQKDILVGDAKLVRTMSRWAPSIVFNKMNPKLG